MSPEEASYWREALRDGDLPVLEIPTDYPRPRERSVAQSVVEITLSGGTGRLLKDPFKVAALWAVSMCRHSLQDEVVIGTATSTDVSSTIPVLVEVPRKASWTAVLSSVHSRLYPARKQRIEIDSLVHHLSKLERDMSRAPIFQTSICVAPSESIVGSSWDACDLVFVVEHGEEVSCKLKFSPALLDTETAHRILEHTRVLSEEVLRCPDVDVWSLSMTSPAEEAVLRGFNDNHNCFLAENTLHGMVQAQAKRTPHHPAVVCGNVKISYSQLVNRSQKLASVLHDAGVIEGSVVGLLLDRSVDIHVAELGVTTAGGAFLPMDPAWPEDRIHYILGDASCAHVLQHRTTTPRNLPLGIVSWTMEEGGILTKTQNITSRNPDPKETRTQQLSRQFSENSQESFSGAFSIGTIHTETSCSDSEDTKILQLSRQLSDLSDSQRFLSEDISISRQHAETPETASFGTTPGSLAYIIYTSGTTGAPKGTLIEHRSVHNYIMMTVKFMKGEYMERFACILPSFFDGSIFERYAPLACGGCSVVCDNVFSMSDDITTFLNVPSALATIPRLPSSVKRVISAAEPLTEAALQNIRIDALREGQLPPRILNFYGPSECAIGATGCWVGDTVTGSIGTPSPNVQCYVVDPELLIPQPIGVSGELLIGGIQVGRGYLNRPDLTKQKFIDCPWDPSLGRLYRTGDLARWMPNGEIAFMGRIDFQVKLRGKRIELGEVENSLTGPGRDVVVVLRTDFDDHQPRLVAYASPGWGDLERVLRQARQTLPEYMVPSAMVDVPSWPFRPGGKLDRKSLPRPSAENLKITALAGLRQEELEVQRVAPRDATERIIVDIMADVLCIDPITISINDNFFNLGGTSLSSAQVIRELEKLKHAENITVTDLMKNPSPSALALCIAGAKNRSEIQKRMSLSSLSKDLSRKMGGSFALCQQRLRCLSNDVANSTSSTKSSTNISSSDNFKSELSHDETSSPSCQADNHGNEPKSDQSTVFRLYPFLTFLGLCLLRVPILVAMSIIFWGALTVANDPTGTIFILMSGVILSAALTFVALVILLKQITSIPRQNWNKRYSMESGVMWRIWFSRNLCRQMESFFSRSLWQETRVVVWLARVMGAEIGSGVLISSCSGLFSEAERIKIGDSVVIEEGARICASAFVPGGVLPVTTVIGNNCIVGVKGMVEAGAKMKPGLVIQPRCTSVGATTDRAILRSFPKPNSFIYLPIVVWVILIHAVALLPVGCVAYLVWDCLSQSGSLPIWNPHERIPWSSVWVVTSIATPSVACVPFSALLYFGLFLFTKKLIGSPRPGYLPDTCGERSRWLLMNVILDSPLLIQLWSLPHSWQRSLLRFGGSRVGYGAFVFLEVLRYDSHLLGFGDGAAIGGDLLQRCCVPCVDNYHMLKTAQAKGPEPNKIHHTDNVRFEMRGIQIGDCAAAAHGAVLTGGTTIGSSGVVGDYTVVENTNVPAGTILIGAPAVRTGQLSQEAIDEAPLSIEVPTFASNFFDFLVWWFILIVSTLVDIWVHVFCILACLSLMVTSWPVPFTQVLAVSVFIASVGDLLLKPFIAIALLAWAKRTILLLPEGNMLFYSWGFRKWVFSNTLFTYFVPWLNDFYGTEIMCVFFRLCGAKIGRGVRLFSGGGPAGQGHVRNELEHLVIEDNVVIDTESLIQGHTIENGGMTFKLTVLGSNSILSSRSNVLPGSRVVKQSNLLEGTLIPPHTTVPGKSLVKGCPFHIVVRQDGTIPVEKSPKTTYSLKKKSVDIDHIVIGAGVCGVLAAKELKARGKSFVVLEKSTKVGGIWVNVANRSSHVAVSEPSYRFDFGEGSVPMDDFTKSDQVKGELEQILQRYELSDHIKLGACVTQLKRSGNTWEVHYQQGGREHIVHAKGAYIATGAQQKPRKLVFDGEETFLGPIGYGIRDDIKLSAYNGCNVCIVGGGAFAVENMRTALLNGAKKVTIVSRSKLQCWPRAVHYRSSCGNATWGQLKSIYDEAVSWAGLGKVVDSFMSPSTRTQPTASDLFYLAFREGKLDIIVDEVSKVSSDKIVTKKGVEIRCDVMLKCVGWEKAQLSDVYASFGRRNFCFLDGHASLVSCSDTVYSHPNDPIFNFTMLESNIASGSTSVVFLAMVTIRLQLFFMDHPDQFNIALKQIVDSTEPTCSWMQERLHYEGLPEAQEVVDELFEVFRKQAKAKFPNYIDFLRMCKSKFDQDASTFLDHPVDYIYDSHIKVEQNTEAGDE